MEMKIITPSGMFGSYEGEHGLETAMRIIGVAFSPDPDDEWPSKYGTNHENDVFAMRRYYWGDCDCGWGDAEHAWCEAHPYSSPEYDAAWQEFLKEHPGHKPTCSLELPNFLYKPTGCEVRWYKYIGRDTEMKGGLPSDFMERIFATHPRGTKLEEAVAEFERREEETAKGFADMMASLNVQT